MKFRVKDEDGNSYVVEEDKEIETVKDEEIEETSETEAMTLSNDEIAVLKQLVEIAPKIMGLIHSDADESIEDEDIDEDEEIDEEEKTEEVIDTDEELEEVEEEKKMTNDSAKAFGSIQKTKSSYQDSSLEENDIDMAWQKRLNGGLK